MPACSADCGVVALAYTRILTHTHSLIHSLASVLSVGAPGLPPGPRAGQHSWQDAGGKVAAAVRAMVPHGASTRALFFPWSRQRPSLSWDGRRDMGDAAGTEIEPPSQRALADETMAVPGVVFACVPGGAWLHRGARPSVGAVVPSLLLAHRPSFPCRQRAVTTRLQRCWWATRRGGRWRPSGLAGGRPRATGPVERARQRSAPCPWQSPGTASSQMTQRRRRVCGRRRACEKAAGESCRHGWHKPPFPRPAWQRLSRTLPPLLPAPTHCPCEPSSPPASARAPRTAPPRGPRRACSPGRWACAGGWTRAPGPARGPCR